VVDQDYNLGAVFKRPAPEAKLFQAPAFIEAGPGAHCAHSFFQTAGVDQVHIDGVSPGRNGPNTRSTAPWWVCGTKLARCESRGTGSWIVVARRHSLQEWFHRGILWVEQGESRQGMDVRMLAGRWYRPLPSLGSIRSIRLHPV
jgi:hypothetical protein